MNNFDGILLMLVAMAGFSLEDLSIKFLARDMAIGQILLTLGLLSTTVFALLALWRGQSLTARSAWNRFTLTRAVAEAASALTFMTALSLLPLSTVAAIFQVVPLALTLAAAVFLGEKVGPHRWSAILIGFAGVLLIIRPGFDGFQPASLILLLTVVSVVIRDLVTRFIPQDIDTLVVSFQGFATLIPVGFLMMILQGAEPVAPSGGNLIYIAMAVVAGVGGYYCIVAAFRLAEASVIGPFRYARLIFSLFLGILFLHERPDLITLTGAAIVIASGLYMFFRERRATTSA